MARFLLVGLLGDDRFTYCRLNHRAGKQVRIGGVLLGLCFKLWHASSCQKHILLSLASRFKLYQYLIVSWLAFKGAKE